MDAAGANESWRPEPNVTTAAWRTLNPWDVMLCASGTAIACENAVVVGAIACTPALRTPGLALVGSLATADLLAGAGLVLRFALERAGEASPTAGLLTAGFLVAALAASVISLLAITLERYLSLRHALTYLSDGRLRRRRARAMLLATWGAALLLGLLPALGWNCVGRPAACGAVRPLTRGGLALLAAAFLLVFALMLALYARICKIVCRHAQQMALQRHLLAASSHYAAARKGASTLAVVLGSLGASWLPFAVYCLLGRPDDPPVYAHATLLPAAYNSMLNPIIYAYRNADVRRAVLGLLCGCCRRPPRDAYYRAASPSDV
ncbi:G-protein coupled receptor 6 isoform X2 [Festucalex cinctus]